MNKSSDLIVESNYIIEATYKLTLQEQKIIYLVLSKINKYDSDLTIYNFEVKDFQKVLETKNKNIYQNVYDTLESLRERDICINKKNSKIHCKWISSVEYYSGHVEIEISKKLKPFLIMLKEEFTKLSLKQMCQFKSQFTCRLYSLLKQYEKISHRNIKIDEFRKMLRLKENQYPKYSNVKQKIIDIATNEINEKTDLSVKYEEVKDGRKVIGLNFDIKHKESFSPVNQETAQSLLIESLSLPTFSDNMKNKVSEWDIERLEKAIKIFKAYQTDKIKRFALLEKIYREDNNFINKKQHQEQEQQQKKNYKSKELKFKNFDERTYDYDSLEKQLLGWSDD